MRFIRGFDEQILEALNSRNESIHYEAVIAAATRTDRSLLAHCRACNVEADREALCCWPPSRRLPTSVPAKPRGSSGSDHSPDADIAEAAQDALVFGGSAWAEDDEYEEEDDDDFVDDDDERNSG
jgi:hypothetical protein